MVRGRFVRRGRGNLGIALRGEAPDTPPGTPSFLIALRAGVSPGPPPKPCLVQGLSRFGNGRVWRHRVCAMVPGELTSDRGLRPGRVGSARPDCCPDRSWVRGGRRELSGAAAGICALRDVRGRFVRRGRGNLGIALRGEAPDTPPGTPSFLIAPRAGVSPGPPPKPCLVWEFVALLVAAGDVFL